MDEIEIFWDCAGLSSQYSGIFRYGRSLQEELHKLGVHPTVYGFDPKIKDFWPDGICWPAKFFSKAKIVGPDLAAFLLRKHLPKRSLIHGLCNFNIPLVARGSSSVLTVHDVIPLIVPSHGLYFQQMKYALPMALERADRVISVSEWTKAQLEERFPQARGKVTVIHHGRLKKACIGREKAIEGGRTRLLFVSRFERYKRFDLLLSILKKQTNFELTVVTDKKGVSYINNLLRTSTEVAKRVRLYLEVTEEVLQSLYQNVDVYVHPSLFEGFGFPLFEATSYGLPCVYTLGSGMDELFDQQLGLGLSPNQGLDDWVQGIEAAKQFSLKHDYFCRAEEFLQNLPTWHQSALAHKNLYNTLS